MPFTKKLIDFIEVHCTEYINKISQIISSCKYENSSLRIECYLSEGELLKPVNSFKVYIGNKLYTFEKTHCLLVYKISSKFSEYNLPLFSSKHTPKVLFIYFKQPKVITSRFIEELLLVLDTKESIKEIIPTTTMNQLLTITGSCEALGKINMYYL